MLREDAISSRPITSKFLSIHYSPIFLQFDTLFFLLALQPQLGVVFYSPLASFNLLADEVS